MPVLKSSGKYRDNTQAKHKSCLFIDGFCSDDINYIIDCIAIN